MSYDWNFNIFRPYLPAFLRATRVTLELGLGSTVLGTILGVPLGMLLRVRGLAPVALFLNDVLRAIPTLVVMLFFYLFPYAQVFSATPMSSFTAALLAMTLVQAVFTADLARAAVDGVSADTVLGARTLGMRPLPIWRHIILPDVIRQILPGLIAFLIANIRASSLASVLGVGEVVFTARIAVGQSARNLEGWIIVSLVYVLLVVPIGWMARALEHSQWLKRR